MSKFVLLLALSICHGLGSLNCLAAEPEVATDPPQVSIGLLRAGLSKTELRTLDLTAALKLALEQNPAIKAQAAVTRQTRAKLVGSLAQFLPDVGVAYHMGTYNGAIQSITPDLLQMKRNTFSPQLFFRFNLSQGGEAIVMSGYNKRLLSAQKTNAQAITQEILHETAVRFYDLERSLADLSSAQAQLAETKENYEASKGKSDEPNALEALQAETQFNEARQQLADVEGASESAALRLNEMLMLPAFVDSLPDTDQKLHPLVPSNMNFQACLTQAQESNPRIKAMSQQLSALEKMLKTAYVTALLPGVNAEWNVGRIGSVSESDLQERFKGGTSRLSFTSRNLGLTSAAGFMDFRARIALLKQQLSQERNLLQRIISEAHVKARTSEKQLVLMQKTLTSARQSRDLALRGVTDGTGKIMNLIQSQASLNQARQKLNETMLTYNRSQVDLVYAMGAASVENLTQGLASHAGPTPENTQITIGSLHE